MNLQVELELSLSKRMLVENIKGEGYVARRCA